MDLRHRHGHAAGDAREDEQALKRAGREVDAPGGQRGGGFGPRGVGRGDAAAEEEGARKDHGEDDGGNEEVGRAPACRFEDGREKERPDRAREVVAGCRDGDGDAAAAHEPVRDVGDQRPEEGGRAEAEEDVRCGEHGDRGRSGGEAEARRDEEGGGSKREGRAPAVDHAAHDEVARGEAQHAERVGQRRARAGRAEFGLDRGHDDDDRPHADVADHRERERDPEPRPGLSAVVDSSHAGDVMSVRGRCRTGFCGGCDSSLPHWRA